MGHATYNPSTSANKPLFIRKPVQASLEQPLQGLGKTCASLKRLRTAAPNIIAWARYLFANIAGVCIFVVHFLRIVLRKIYMVGTESKGAGRGIDCKDGWVFAFCPVRWKTVVTRTSLCRVLLLECGVQMSFKSTLFVTGAATKRPCTIARVLTALGQFRVAAVLLVCWCPLVHSSSTDHSLSMSLRLPSRFCSDHVAPNPDTGAPSHGRNWNNPNLSRFPFMRSSLCSGVCKQACHSSKAITKISKRKRD